MNEYCSFRRNCYYNSERFLSLFKVYSETNCFVECVANYTIQNCDCVTFSTPRFSFTKICALGKLSCVRHALRIFQNDSLLKATGSDICDCKPACTSLSYDADSQYSPAHGLQRIYDQLQLDNTEL